MKPTHLLILLSICTSSQAATVLPLAIASTPAISTTITAGGVSLMDGQSASFIVGPGGALVDYNITLGAGIGTVSQPGQFPSYFGEGSTDLNISFQPLFFNDIRYNSQVGIIDTEDNPLLCANEIANCTFSINSVPLPPGTYTALASVITMISSTSSGPGPFDVELSRGVASVNLTVLSGDVSVAPEPSAWLLVWCGFTALLVLRHRKLRAC